MDMPDWAKCSRRKRHPRRLASALSVTLALLKSAVTGIGIPGLEPVVNGIVGVIELIKDVRDNDSNLGELNGLLMALANAISMAPNLHPGVEEVPRPLRSRVDDFLLSLHRLLVEVNQMLGDKNFLIMAANSRAHKEAIADINAKINRLLHQFTAQGTLSLELDVASARQDIRSVMQAQKDLLTGQKALLTGQKALLTGQNAQEHENLVNAIPRVHARYNDTSTKPSRPCHPGTRIDLLQAIRAWIYGGLDMTPYFWLCGEVGVGKTTVTHSVAQENEALHQLGASFFFSRYDEKRRTPNLLFTSIAYQLARFDPRIFKALAEVLKPDPDIVNRSPMEQFKRLVLQPLSQSGLGASQKVIIVIDGLDECTDPALILDVLTQGIDDAGVHLRVLISSRPYASILSKFNNPRLCQITSETQFRDINPDVLSADVTAYLSWELGALALRSHLLSPWPPQVQLDELIRRAAGLFIIASSYTKYIDNPEVGSPVDQLQRILSRQRRVGSSPLAELDALYDQVLGDLKAKLPSDVAMARDILAFVIHGQGDIDVQLLAGLLSVDSPDVRLVLRHLAAVIPLPDDDYAKIVPFHASFGEYIQDLTRCTSREFASDAQAACGRMVARCFDVIASAAHDGIIGVEYDSARGKPWTPPEPLSHAAINLNHYVVNSLPDQVNQMAKNVTGSEMWVMFNIISGIRSLDDCMQLITAIPGGFKDLPNTGLNSDGAEPSRVGVPLRRLMAAHYTSEINDQVAEKAVIARTTIEVTAAQPMRRQALDFNSPWLYHTAALQIVRDVRCWVRYTHKNVMSFKGVDMKLNPEYDVHRGHWVRPQVLVFVEFPVGIRHASTLQRYLEASVDLDMVSRVRLAWGIADGLHYLHGRYPPQPYNAINPNHIMVSSEGQPILYPSRWNLHFRSNPSPIGTGDADNIPCEWQQDWTPERYYWNPTARGVWQRSLASRLQFDVWDFGSILYEVLTGEDPLMASSRLLERNSTMSYAPRLFWAADHVDRYKIAVPLLLDNLQASDDFKELLKACWTVEPESRPPMSEVFERLGAIVKAMET